MANVEKYGDLILGSGIAANSPHGPATAGVARRNLDPSTIPESLSQLLANIPAR